MPAGLMPEERATGEVPGSFAFVGSGTSAQHQDNSSIVKRPVKRKRLDQNHGQGSYNSCG